MCGNGKKINLEKNCNEELCMQNHIMELLRDFLKRLMELRKESIEREYQYEVYQVEYKLISDEIEAEIAQQNELKASIRKITQELASSKHAAEIPVCKVLGGLIEKSTRKLETKFIKKLSKAEIKEYQEKAAALEEQKRKNYELIKLDDQLKAAQIHNREIKAVYDQKNKRHEMLKKTLNDVKERKEKQMKEKEELMKELERLNEVLDISTEDSSDDSQKSPE